MKLLFTVRKPGFYLGDVYQLEDGTFMADGQFGGNEYATVLDLMKGLAGFGIIYDEDIWF